MSIVAESLAQWIDLIAPPRPGSPALFLDRDGTIIENSDYLADPVGVVPIAGAAAAIARFRSAGFGVVVVTNQSGIARGLVRPKQYAEVNRRMLQSLGAGLINAVLACPFHPEGAGPWRATHPWRKPAPGMLLDAAAMFQLDLNRSVMVGDSLSDLRAGLAAGVRRLVHVATGHGTEERDAVCALAEEIPETIELLGSIGELHVTGATK